MRFSRLILARGAAAMAVALLLAGLLSSHAAHVSAQTPGTTVTYPAGWNLVAFPPNTDLSQVSGSLYTMQPGDTSYETIQPSQGTQSGYGYWAYFSAQTQITLDAGSQNVYGVDLPPGQWVLIGNPSGTQPALVSGADVVYTYDPTNTANPYNSTPILQPGQGAWVYSAAGTPITVQPGNAAPPPPAGSQPPSGRFYGAVTVHGAPASGGATVTATASDGATCGTTQVGAPPASGSNYALDLTGGDPGCTTPGSALTFTVAGSAATTSAPATVPDVSTAVHVDLTVP